MKGYLLGIDVGTSACKVALFDQEGNTAAQASEPYHIYYPAPGYVEQDPEEWWNGICEAIRRMLSSGGVDPKLIAGIGVDGQSWSAIPVGRDGKVLHNTPIWMDTRASGIAAETAGLIGTDRIFGISGNSFEPAYTTPKILWFMKEKPDVFNKTFRFLQSNSYIAYKLTGKMTQDISQGYGLHFFNISSQKYDEKFCGELGIPIDMFPEIHACHDVIGEVTSEAAAATGLCAGIPVVAGGLDAACGTLGAGVCNVGETQVQGGQAGGMSICVNAALSHPRLILSPHVVPGLWLLQGGTTGGGSLKWFKEQLGAYEEGLGKSIGESAFKVMDSEAQSVGPGSEGLIFLPYMAGERSPIWDKNAQGVFFGLGYNKTRAHLIRSVMEGCAYALYHNLQTAEEAGVRTDVLNAMGGAANSSLWMQINADVTGKVIRVPSTDTATTLGAAILAGVGTGMYKGFEEAVQRTIMVRRVYEPDMDMHVRYMKYYGIYLEIYDRLKDTMRKCSEL